MAFYHRKLGVLDKLGPGKLPEDDTKNETGCKLCDDGCPNFCNQFPPPPPSKDPIPTPLILTVCIVAAAFLFMICLAIQRYRSKRRNSRRLENEMFRDDFIDALHEPVIHPIWYIRTIGLPQSVIDSIEVFNYKKGEGLIEGSDCSICLSEFEEDESLRLLPKCSHAFHVSCIDTWLRSHMNCPVCRAPIVNSNANPVNSMDHTSSSSSVSTEENQVENEVETEQTGEIRNSNETSSELPVEDEKMAGVLLKGNGSNSRLRVLSDLVDHRVKVDQELEPVRRSVSMDISSASKIYQAVANIQGKNDEGSWKSTPFQGPVSMKRSVSSNGKRSLRKDSRVQDSIPI